MSWGACEHAFGRAGNWGEGKAKIPVGELSAIEALLISLYLSLEVHVLEKS